jgi:cardiolipin synthase
MLRFISVNWFYLATIANVGLAMAVTIHAVLWKRDSRAVIGWVGLAWLAPILGVIAYFCFGVNRIQRKASSLGLRDAKRVAITAHPLRDIGLAASCSLTDRYPTLAGLVTLGDRLTQRPAVAGNKIALLVNGDGAYPAMLQSIREAQRSIALLSYIFDFDRAGAAFLDELKNARNRGIEVRVLIDSVGSKYSRPNMVGELRKAGLTVATFLPARPWGSLQYANLRNHRKILVIDGKIGFTGGTNIREGHWLSLKPDFPVQCLHFRLEGPVVEHLQEAFVADWVFASGEVLSADTWFPKIDAVGNVWARGIPHGPDEDFEKMIDVIIGALAVARRRVRIVTPYFLPDSPLIKAIVIAAMRGVDVEVFLPSTCNIRLVQWAAAAQLWQLLEKDCRVFLTPPPFDHTKLLVVDDLWSLIGSTNWDPRSLRLNFEFNVECYDERLAQELNAVIDVKLKSAEQLSLEDVNSRPIFVKLRDGLARLMSPYL